MRVESDRARSSSMTKLVCGLTVLFSVDMGRAEGTVCVFACEFSVAFILRRVITSRASRTHRGTLQSNSGQRDVKDTVIVGLVGDGSCARCFYVTGSGKVDAVVDELEGEVVVLPGVKATGNKTTQAYFEFLFNERYLIEDDLVLTDRHKAHMNDDLLEQLTDRGIEYDFFPPGAAALLSPADNAFNATFKLRNNQELARLQRINVSTKIVAAFNAYDSITDESVQNWMRLCGITGGDPVKVVDRLLSSGYGVGGPHTKLHHDQRVAFKSFDRKWRYTHTRRREWDFPICVGQSSLDGKQWTVWGFQK
jgi:hypothetical protein